MEWFNWFIIISALCFWAVVLYRISHPYKCTCNATFLWFSGYRKHVNMKHGVA